MQRLTDSIEMITDENAFKAGLAMLDALDTANDKVIGMIRYHMNHGGLTIEHVDNNSILGGFSPELTTLACSIILNEPQIAKFVCFIAGRKLGIEKSDEILSQL